jgi:hypothetical protein
MTSSLTCREDAELLAVAAGEEPSEELRKHLDECPSCSARLARYRAEVELFRQEALALSSPPLAVSSLTAEPVTSNGRTDHPDLGMHRPAERTETDRGAPRGEGPSEECAHPTAIGKYLVIGRFPRTGQAEVYRVVHPGLAKDLVLKLALNPVEPGVRHEIVEEGKILAELTHPNLVQVHDLDWHDDRPYIVMDYIRGRSLEQLATEGRLTPRHAAALLAKVAAAADCAHRHGIIHCDIKPTNILVDEAGEPKLIDFGMVRLRHAWSEDPGKPGGTFAFMAPEQARVESQAEQQKVGPRSDVFALGAALYFLLTGKAPFEAPTWRQCWDRARRCDFDATALKDCKVPAPLRRICLKSLAADPVERFNSAADLARSLKTFLRRRSLIAVAAFALVVPAAVLALWFLWPPPAPAPAAGALTGELIVRVWSPGEGGKRGLKIDEPGALPLLAGELVHLEAKLNQPAYPYLLWLDGQGRASLLYPRDDGKFGSSQFDGSARDDVHSPEALDGGHRMAGPAGRETVLLLAGRRPLPQGTDLVGLIGHLPPSPLTDQHRGIDEAAHEIDEPLLQVMERLRTRGPFDVIETVRFAYLGE